MKPYWSEIRFSHMDDLRSVVTASYEVGSVTSAFEEQVRADFAEARGHHLKDELARALDGYQRLQAVILRTLAPTLRTDVTTYPGWRAPLVREFTPTLISAVAAGLTATPAPLPSFPPAVAGPDPLPSGVLELLQPFAKVGFAAAVTADVGQAVRQAADAVGRQAWPDAVAYYNQALKRAGEDQELRGYLSHDLALVTMRGGALDAAAKLLQQSQRAFEAAKSTDGQVAALTALADVQIRQGNTGGAKELTDRAYRLSASGGLTRLGLAPSRSAFGIGDDSGGLAVTVTPDGVKQGAAGGADGQGDTIAAPAIAAHAQLRALSFLDTRSATRAVSLLDGDGKPVTLQLGSLGVTQLTDFYTQLRTTTDVSLLHYLRLPLPVFQLYMCDLYFFTLPMSIGDCLSAMGDTAKAEEQYLGASGYLYLNPLQTVRVWTRLAGLYLDQADSAYRAAGQDLGAVAAVAPLVGKVVAADGTVPDASPLYARPAFAAMKARVRAVLAAPDPVALEENPEIVRLVVKARSRQRQIAAGLNYFGFPPDYVPPFGFEYLQNIARYFAQHAAGLEQGYIQFKSQAENEEFRREQMEQQVELARATVGLEQRGLDEARAGVAVAEAGVGYAERQRAAAVDNKQRFEATRGQLLELAELEAWANAAAQDQDDEVHQTISGYTYYNTSDRRRSLVVQDLERARTMVAQGLESARLTNEIAVADAYLNVTRAQRAQALTRVAIAQERVQIARLQQRQATENRDFLDMKEFSARLWYELARTLRALAADYLDSATEIAMLMERAYAAETGRDLRKIRFDYRAAGAGGLLGADVLQRDIDYFTLDLLTTTRTKKAPVKVGLSLADRYPTAFRTLKETGTATFATTLEQFDRMYPGFFLHKVRNVELLLVGVTNGAGIHGTLRNIGASSFRDADGTVRSLVYPADVMPLSMYDTRADAVVFQPDGQRLRLFENNGLATMWRVDLPPGAGGMDLGQLIDVQLVLSFDAFFDPALETRVRSELPTTGSAAKATSLRLTAPDELFYLRQQGEARVPWAPADFPVEEKDRARTALAIRLTGPPELVGGLTLTVTPDGHAPVQVVTAADGTVSGSPPAGLLGADPVVPWAVTVPAADNPGRPATGDHVDLRGLTDFQVYQEYTFVYR